MSARERLRDPLLYAAAVFGLGLGGAARGYVAPEHEGVSAELYEAEVGELGRRLGRIEDKLDRLLERGVVR